MWKCSLYLHIPQVLLCEAVRVSVCVHASMCVCVCFVCVACWHGAKVNRGLVSVLNAFLDLTGHVQAYRHANEVCVCVCVYVYV